MDGQRIRSQLIVFYATLETYAPTWKMKPSDLLRVFDTEQISADMISRLWAVANPSPRESLSWLRIRSTITGSHFGDDA